MVGLTVLGALLNKVTWSNMRTSGSWFAWMDGSAICEDTGHWRKNCLGGLVPFGHAEFYVLLEHLSGAISQISRMDRLIAQSWMFLWKGIS